jgi:hypothetical protein
MVYATAENRATITETAIATGLSWDKVVRAMSNERRRLKRMGYTEADLQLINTTGGLSKELDDIKKSLQTWVDQKRCPDNLQQELLDVALLVVCMEIIYFMLLYFVNHSQTKFLKFRDREK